MGCCQVLINNKKGQFFILAAVILAVIIIGLGVVYNTVSVSESSNKFYSYSDQLKKETGAVVDYSLYSGTAKVDDFMDAGVSSVLNSYPELDVFACYTSNPGTDLLTCDNYGSYGITIYYDSSVIPVEPGTINTITSIQGVTSTQSIQRLPKRVNFNAGSSKNLTVNSGGINYTIDLSKAGASDNQYYFIFRANTTAGNELAAQTGSGVQ